MGNVDSGVVGKILSFVRAVREGVKLSDIKTDVGGGEILTAEMSHPSGDDSQPLPDDYVTLVRIRRSGRVIAVGFTETDAEQTAGPGEKRIYSRNVSTREEMAQVWLKNTGEIRVDNDDGSMTLNPDGSQRFENANGYIELQEDGTVNINGATINPNGDIESPTTVISPSVEADGRELAGHDHAITSGSSAPGPTGPNNP